MVKCSTNEGLEGLNWKKDKWGRGMRRTLNVDRHGKEVEVNQGRRVFGGGQERLGCKLEWRRGSSCMPVNLFCWNISGVEICGS